MAGPLSGIKILDFCRALQGPFGTMLLADLGAEVIRVEDPGAPVGGKPDDSGFSAQHEIAARSKKSIAVDLRSKEGLEVIRRIVPQVDVVVENYRPGVMEKIGIGYDDLKALNEKIILASASAWGRSGPYANRPGYDHVAQALSGVMSTQGSPEQPHALIAGFADVVGGTYLALGVVAAIVARDRLGVGQHVDSSLLGSMMIIQGRELTDFFRTGKQVGFQDVRMPTYTHYRCSDGRYIAVAATREPMWVRLCEALGIEHLATSEKFETGKQRSANSAELHGILTDIFVTDTQQSWEERLVQFDVPCAPVLDYEGVAQHEQFRPNQYIADVDHPLFGRVTMPGLPIRFSETAAAIANPAPIPGENTTSVLKSFGFSDDQISEYLSTMKL